MISTDCGRISLYPRSRAMALQRIYVFLCAILVHSGIHAIHLPNTTFLPTDFAPDSIKRIIEGLGFLYESYEVETEDGYIVNLNRMVNPDLNHTTDKGVPVLMINGLFTQADAWFIQTDPKLNIPVRWMLEGYDVWVGDQRGTYRSLKHKYLSASSWRFWDFSFHETGYYDMPAWIDFILKKTGHEKLAYSGLSDGGASYYVMTSTRPEYQEKLYGGILWAPAGEDPPLWSMKLIPQMWIRVAYSLLHVSWDLSPLVLDTLATLSPSTEVLKKALYHVCKSLPLPDQKLLLYGMFSDGCQYSQDPETVCNQLVTASGGTSTKNVLHTIQLFRNAGGKFQQYDYGWIGNLLHYQHMSPPVYDISKLKLPTAIYYSNRDIFAPNTTVVPFAHKFNGPVYLCQIEDVCHVFALFDSRVAPFLEDATNVLNRMTGKTTENAIYWDLSLKNGSTNAITTCNVKY